jgi:hypothetical protein
MSELPADYDRSADIVLDALYTVTRNRYEGVEMLFSLIGG